VGFEFSSVVALKNSVCWDVIADKEAIAAAFCLLGLLFDPEGGGTMLLQNISKTLPNYMYSHSRR
jgi:hypothetical protein